MLVVFHVLSALISLIASTYLCFYPSRFKLFVSYGLTTMTLSSGTYLAWRSKAQLAQACVSGLVYLGVISILIFLARRKLANATPKV